MKQKIVCLLVAAACFSMTACEKTPDKSLVTQKNIDRLEEAAKEKPEDGSTLKDIIETTTDTYSFNYESDDKKIKITADNVQVTLPTKDTIPMYHVKCGGISQEVTDKVYDYFFPEGAYSTTGTDVTKEALDKEIMSLKQYNATVKDDTQMSEEEREETIQQNEDLIQKCEEDKKTAPDESTLKTVPKDSTYVDQEWQTLGGTEMVKGLTVNSEDSKRSLNVVSADDDSSMTSFLRYSVTGGYNYSGQQGTPARSCSDEEKQQIGISEEDARKYVDDFVQKTGMDWKIHDTLCIRGFTVRENEDTYGDSGDMIYPEHDTAYKFILAHNVDGIQSAVTSSAYVPDECDDAYITWLYEQVSVVVEPDGIVDFEWQYPLEVEDSVSDNVGIISFDQAKDIFEQMMPLTTKGDLEEWSDDENSQVSITADVSDIRLGLMRVRSSGNEKSGLLTPVWIFYGDYTQSVHFLPGKGDGQEDYDNTQEQPWILLAVNAVDGSVIDVTAGY